MTTPNKVNIQIQADEATKSGDYCNLAMIAHSPEEFILDFIFIVQNPPYGKLKSRVVMSAGHAKRLMRALAENVARYESQFGTIPDTPMPPSGTVN
jgi:hypothetical protein